MITIRENTFETNSSSCHALIKTKESLFDKFRHNELVLVMYQCYNNYDEDEDREYLNESNYAFLTWEELFAQFKNEIKTNIERTEYPEDYAERDINCNKNYWNGVLSSIIPNENEHKNNTVEDIDFDYFKEHHNNVYPWVIVDYNDFCNSENSNGKENFAKIYKDRVELEIEYHD